MTIDWINQFDGLTELEPEFCHLINSQSRLVSVPSDTEVFAPEKPAENMMFLLEGTVRVQQVSESGREIVLYRIESGQGCIMTATCLLGHQDYSAQGVAETELKAVMLAKHVFEELVSKSAVFRSFVFSTFSMRLTELMLIINEVAFRKLDIRLAGKLIELSGSGVDIKTTHHQLSSELGTAREVVSRQLQEFQRKGWIGQARGTITLLNKGALKQLVASS